MSPLPSRATGPAPVALSDGGAREGIPEHRHQLAVGRHRAHAQVGAGHPPFVGDAWPGHVAQVALDRTGGVPGPVSEAPVPESPPPRIAVGRQRGAGFGCHACGFASPPRPCLCGGRRGSRVRPVSARGARASTPVGRVRRQVKDGPESRQKHLSWAAPDAAAHFQVARRAGIAPDHRDSADLPQFAAERRRAGPRMVGIVVVAPKVRQPAILHGCDRARNCPVCRTGSRPAPESPSRRLIGSGCEAVPRAAVGPESRQQRVELAGEPAAACTADAADRFEIAGASRGCSGSSSPRRPAPVRLPNIVGSLHG